NEICDVVSDLALILPFAAVAQFGAWGVVAFAIAAALTEFAGVLGIAAGIGRNYAGPFGKSDRALALGVVAVLAAAGLWPAVIAEARGAVVLFHRGHEHGGRMAHLIEELRMPDRAFYAWDAHGNGRSAGERGYAPSFAALVRDIDCFMREIAARDSFDMQDIALIAQSFGAVLAAAWVHDYA